MIYLVIIAVVAYVVIQKRRQPKSTYDYYKQEYDSYMKEKKRKNRPKRSLCLLIAFFLSVVYFLYLLVCLTDGLSPNIDEWEALGWMLGASLMLPHIICLMIATLFDLIGWAARSRSCALVSAVLYIVSMAMMPLYFMFVVVQMVLSFVGFALMKQNNS